MPHIPLLPALADLHDKYDLLFCDIWGVVHNGVQQHEPAVSALRGFRAKGGQVALVTNAPRPAFLVAEMLDRFGVPDDAFDVIISSGDVTQTLIKSYAGQTVHHVGPEYDLQLFDDTGVQFGSAEESVAIVVSDLDEKGEELSLYEDRLQLWKDLDLPLICANPDKVVEVGDQLILCGGALADCYAEIGGKVTMAGKPFAPIYDHARFKLKESGLPPVDPKRTLAIGDAERTDARGAAMQEVDFLFVSGSIHAQQFATKDQNEQGAAIEQLLRPSGVNCVGFLPMLR